jgi:hypothetical protein
MSGKVTRSKRSVDVDVHDRINITQYVTAMRKSPARNAEIFTQVELCAAAHGLNRSIYVLTKGDNGWRWVKFRGFGDVVSYRADGAGGITEVSDWGILADGIMNEVMKEVPQSTDIAIVNYDNIHFRAAPACALLSWTCSTCYFENMKLEYLSCEVCGASKPNPTGAPHPKDPHLLAAPSTPQAASQLKVSPQPKPRNVPQILLDITNLVRNGIVTLDRAPQYIKLVNSASGISSMSTAVQSLVEVVQGSTDPILLKKLADNLLSFLETVLCCNQDCLTKQVSTEIHTLTPIAVASPIP